MKMTARSWCIAPLLLGVFVCAMQGVASAAEQPDGRSLFGEHCSACHGADGRGVPGVPDLTRGTASRQSDAALFETLREGKGVMPGFDGLLDTGELLAVIDALRTLRR